MSLDIREVSSQAILEVNRYDTARRLVITLTDNGTPYHIADGCFATFTAKKPDNTFLNNACVIEGNTIIYDFTEQTAIAAGDMACEIVLYGADGNRITSPSFTIYVDPTVYDEEAIEESASEMTALNKLVTQANAVVVEGNDLIETIKVKLANGEFNGKDGKDAESGANALKGYASGTVIQVSDVSPTPHTVSCKILTESPSAVTVTRGGKNLYPIGALNKANWNGDYYYFDLPAGTYTWSAKNNITDGKYGFFYIHYSVDNWATSSRLAILAIDMVFNKTQTFTVEKGMKLRLFYLSNGGALSDFYNIQIEVGNAATEYEPCVEVTTHPVNADGSVEIYSVFPTMTILSDNADAVIECEYNRDANKVVAELLDLIQRIAEKEDYITLLASKWAATSVSGRYEQVVAVDGVTPKSTVIMDLSLAQAETFRAKDLAFFLVPGDGIVTVYAIGQKPTNDYTLRVRYKEAI